MTFKMLLKKLQLRASTRQIAACEYLGDRGYVFGFDFDLKTCIDKAKRLKEIAALERLHRL